MFCLCVACGHFEDIYETVNMLCVASMFSLIRGDSADHVAMTLQFYTFLIGWKRIPKVVLVWAMLITYFIFYHSDKDLLHLGAHFVHFVCFALFFVYVQYLMFVDLNKTKADKND